MFNLGKAPDESPLASAPVEMATFQIDFEQERPLKSQDGIAWQSGLAKRGYRLPSLTRVKQQSINIEINARPMVTGQMVGERDGWQTTMEDGASNFSLFATSVQHVRAHYPGFAGFRSEILDSYGVAAKLLKPTVQNRVMLSYANALSDPKAKTSAFWQGKVRPHFLGAVCDEALRADFVRSLSLFTFLHDSYAADLRVGVQPDQVHKGRIAFVFQTEVAQNDVCVVTQDSLASTIDALHTLALKLFYSVLEDRYVEELRAGGERNDA